MAINHGISFAWHDKQLTSLDINEFLETSNKDIAIPREKKKTHNRRHEITQVTRKG